MQIFADTLNSISCLWKSPAQSSLAPSNVWSKSGNAFGNGKYLNFRIFLTGVPLNWPGCQYKLKICQGRLVRHKAILLTCKCCVATGCGIYGCGAGDCGAGGFCLIRCAANRCDNIVLFYMMSCKLR